MNVALVVDAPTQRFFDSLRLLEDFLEHEVLVTALLGRPGIPGDRDGIAFDCRSSVIRQTIPVAPDDRDLTLLQNDLAPRVWQNRGRVGGDEHLAVADAQHEWACAVTRKDEMLGIVARNYAEGVRAANLVDRTAHGRFKIAIVMELDKMREDFRVGLAAENMP